MASARSVALVRPPQLNQARQLGIAAVQRRSCAVSQSYRRAGSHWSCRIAGAVGLAGLCWRCRTRRTCWSCRTLPLAPSPPAVPVDARPGPSCRSRYTCRHHRRRFRLQSHRGATAPFPPATGTDDPGPGSAPPQQGEHIDQTAHDENSASFCSVRRQRDTKCRGHRVGADGLMRPSCAARRNSRANSDRRGAYTLWPEPREARLPPQQRGGSRPAC